MPLLETVLPELVSTMPWQDMPHTGAVNATSAAVLPASSPPLFAWALWLWVSGVIAVSLTLLVLHRVYDAYVGCQKCNARETPAKYPALSEPHIIQPTSITLLHALQFLLVQLNYVVHLFCCLAFWLRVHCWPFAWGQLAKDADFDRVVSCLLETTLLIYLRPEGEEGTSVYRMSIRNFASPLFPNSFSNTIDVVVDVEARAILGFKFNDVDIEHPTEMLSLLILVVSTYTHPIVHSYNDHLYSQREGAADYNEIFMHGQSLNERAHVFPGMLLGCGRDWLQETLEFNASRGFPHHSARTLRALLPHSRFGRFLLRARTATFGSVRRHKVRVNPELFFLCSTLHSVDHHMVGELVRGYNMEHYKMPNCGMFVLTALLFYQPNGYEWVHHNSLRNAAQREGKGFYTDLYAEFCDADQELADVVTLSISY